ncbi:MULTISPECIES: hypothetical protein [Acinetobacter calcoaceticus/baumannii complex]|uniref:Uncharacterized protein n=1 Tax=Acinetobacter baumannii (strain AB307-0294) TaxID=557600 RepID=A0A5K6CLL6_ACIB3|nr:MULTISPECIES: hypothetical protein [Acinetobacter calcoaceticus/baumannii complex]ATY42704.1 hypothetical protein ABBFA_00230 [Acinetobacter baumannii AB307-0294]MDC4276335.1 hypothetical protein [Acinetobacter baumannii]MDC4399540.1 hypothetical protein [Acinetobacter baumannii]MDC4869139.1 hypothetical protein [Acinetobacter baumannii]MDC5381276.1 hypothetical protein [Acinetobacter baumannii]
MSVYLPKKVYDALKAKPDLTIEEVMKIQNSPYSTAARYRQKFKELHDGGYLRQVHHQINKTKIERWRRINHQFQQMTDLLTELLNTSGFESTGHLREIYYGRFSRVKGIETQSRRNFNRYFKRAREEIDFSKFKLKIYKSSITRVGFYTAENPEFKPSDC